MTAHLARAAVLVEQHRYEQAIGELQLHLGQQSDDPTAHALLSQCFLELERYDEAQAEAQQAIHLAPDEPLGFRMLAGVFLMRNRFREAADAITAALAIDPYDPDLYGLQASIFAQLQRWRDAVNAADEGLALDPEHTTCLNVRAQALVMLGDRAGAAQTVQDALRKNPDDPWIHANQGWASLHANEPTKAAEHFREALRLDPTMEFARAGIIEALKARNFLYRGMLQYFLWMARLPTQARWGVIIGVLVAQRFLNSLGNNNPALAPYTTPVLILVIAFAVLTWLSYPLFNLMLRLDRFGRYVLSTEERAGANLLGGTLLIAIAFLIGYFVFGGGYLLWGALVFGFLSLPASMIYVIDAGWPRNLMAACTGLLLLIGIPGMVPPQAILAINNDALTILMVMAFKAGQVIFPIGAIASQLLANVLVGVKVKK